MTTKPQTVYSPSTASRVCRHKTDARRLIEPSENAITTLDTAMVRSIRRSSPPNTPRKQMMGKGVRAIRSTW